MRKLSCWAKHHPRDARLIIVFSKLGLAYIAYFFSAQIEKADIDVSALWIYLFLILFVSASVVYPSGRSAATYVRRKLCDSALVVLGFLMYICLFVQLQRPAVLYQDVQATVPAEVPGCKDPEAQKLLAQFESGEKTKFTRKEKRIIRREFNHQLLQYASATITGNKEAKSNAGAIILICLAAVGLLFLVASLACSLSCNGHDAAAGVVGIGGTILVVLGVILAIRGLRRKKPEAQ